MKINQNTVLLGQRVILVPYRKEHVQVYHQWMQDPFLQETTKSEPLTLEEEYEMQVSWRDDENKCTFILLDTDYDDTPGTGRHGGAMAGDVNLYLNDAEDMNCCEIEVMVAEECSRRKGIAKEALMLFMAYAADKLSICRFVAKISDDNTPSIQLFQALGFQHSKDVPVFREVHFEFLAQGDNLQKLLEAAARLQYGLYDEIG